MLTFRLERLGLGDGRAKDPARALIAPASDFSRDAAMLAISARSQRLTREAYAKAVDTGRIVRAHTLRAAIHVQRPSDFSLYGRALIADDDVDLARQLGRQMTKILERTAIPASEALAEVTKATTKALVNGRKLGKDELHEELRGHVREELMPWCKGCSTHHVAPMLWRFASVDAGARRDFDGRYLIGRPKPKGRQAPLDALRRFLSFYGPSTSGGFATWSSLPKAHASRIWDEIDADELVEVEWKGGSGSVLADDLEDLRSAARASGVRLIPPGDPYLVQPDRATLAPDKPLSKRIFRPVASPGVVLVDGRIAGLWKVRAKGKRSDFEIEELRRIPHREAEAEAERIAALRGSTDHGLTWS